MRNEFVNSHSIKIHDRTLHFLPPAACGNVFPIKNCQNTWRSGSRLARGQMNMADEAKLHSPAHSTFFFSFNFWSIGLQHVASRYLEKNGAHSVDQCQLQALQFSVHLINLLSIHLRYYGFAGIQKAVMGQTSSRPPNTFFCASLALGSALELLLGPTTELVVTSCIQSTFHHTS